MGRTQSGRQVLRAEAVNIAGLPEKMVDVKVHYHVQVFADDGKGQKFIWTVFKRYSDFNTLRSEVDAKWGGAKWVEATNFLAGANQHFPPKEALKGADERVVAERKEVRWPCV
jgi:hypothetical protein